MNADTAVTVPVATEFARWGTERPFSDGIRLFHECLAGIDWAKRAPGLVFVRDYEGLPDRAPFDIDAMAEEADLPSCRTIFEETASEIGLVCLVQTGSAGINILVLELTQAPTHRTWSYFEISTHKKLSRDFTIRPRDMDIVRTEGLPVPSTSWRFAINLLQALRRTDLTRYRPVLEECLRCAPDCAALVAEKLGLEASEIDQILAAGPALQTWQARLDIAVKPAKATTTGRPWRNRVRLAALKRFYMLSAREMYLISVHGADGVGKSTACDLVAGVFAGYPIGLDAFHHVTSWKHKARPSGAPPTDAVHVPPPASPLRRLLRIGYRLAPEFIRDGWRAMTGYHHYGRSLNREVFRGYLEHRIMLLDRYVYDMYLKLIIRGASGRPGMLIGHLACRFMRKPKLAILIADRPEDVIQRKQELSLQEIENYQVSMERLLTRIRVPHEVIYVAGRDANAVADELARAIIDAIGTDLLQLMRYTVNPVRPE